MSTTTVTTATTKKPQITIGTLFLLILLAALTLRLVIVEGRFRKLLAETSSLVGFGGEAYELRTQLGYLVPEDASRQLLVPIPPIGGNSRSFRLYLPKVEGRRLLNLGMTAGSTRYMLPTTNDNWPVLHQFQLSEAEEQIITVAWIRSASGQWVFRVERTDFPADEVELKDAAFLESPEDWHFYPFDLRVTSPHPLGESFRLWEAFAGKKTLSPDEFGAISGFRLWVETLP